MATDAQIGGAVERGGVVGILAAMRQTIRAILAWAAVSAVVGSVWGTKQGKLRRCSVTTCRRGGQPAPTKARYARRNAVRRPLQAWTAPQDAPGRQNASNRRFRL